MKLDLTDLKLDLTDRRLLRTIQRHGAILLVDLQHEYGQFVDRRLEEWDREGLVRFERGRPVRPGPKLAEVLEES